VPTLAQPLDAQGKTAQRQPIIDMHMHVHAADERWKLRIRNPVTQPMTAPTSRRTCKRRWRRWTAITS
jgi:hypothetical protein